MKSHSNQFPTAINGVIVKPPAYINFLLGMFYPFWGRHFVGISGTGVLAIIFFSKSPVIEANFGSLLPFVYILLGWFLFAIVGWYGMCLGFVLGKRNRAFSRDAKFISNAFVAYFSKFAPGIDVENYRREVRAGFARTRKEFAYAAFMEDCAAYFEQWTIAYRAQQEQLRQQAVEGRRKEKEARKAKNEQAKIAQARVELSKVAVIEPEAHAAPAPVQAGPVVKPALNVLRSDPRKFVEEYGYAQGVKGLPLNSGFIEQELKERFGKNFEDYRRTYTIAHSAGMEVWQAGNGSSYKVPAELRGVPLVR